VQNVHSQLVSLIAENNFPTEDICFANCWANESGKANPFFWEELEIVKHLSKKGSYWFFHFPEPEREPEAIYGMVVQDENKEWYYYTLEMGRDQFFFCQTKNGRHKLITSISGDCKEEMFKKMVFEHLKK
jgi:hypothetical protein